MKMRFSPARCCCGGPAPVFDCSWMPPGVPGKVIKAVLTTASGSGTYWFVWHELLGWRYAGNIGGFYCANGNAYFVLSGGLTELSPSDPACEFTRDPFRVTWVNPNPTPTNRWSLDIAYVDDPF